MLGTSNPARQGARAPASPEPFNPLPTHIQLLPCSSAWLEYLHISGLSTSVFGRSPQPIAGVCGGSTDVRGVRVMQEDARAMGSWAQGRKQTLGTVFPMLVRA